MAATTGRSGGAADRLHSGKFSDRTQRHTEYGHSCWIECRSGSARCGYQALACDNVEYMTSTSTQNLNLWKQNLGRVPDSVWESTGLETLVLADNDLRE